MRTGLLILVLLLAATGHPPATPAMPDAAGADAVRSATGFDAGAVLRSGTMSQRSLWQEESRRDSGSTPQHGPTGGAAAARRAGGLATTGAELRTRQESCLRYAALIALRRARLPGSPATAPPPFRIV